MITVPQIVAEISEFLAGELPLEQLDDWSAEALREIYRQPDTRPRDLMLRVRSVLNAHFDEPEDSPALYEELENTIRPFEENRVIVFGDAPKKGIGIEGGSSRKPERLRVYALA